jgi:hypothetical protein
MSKATEIWEKGIGSVHGADVTNKLCYETASGLAAYARELEKEQSDLDWLEGEIKSEYDLLLKHSEYNNSEHANGLRMGFRAVRTFIKARKEAKS